MSFREPSLEELKGEIENFKGKKGSKKVIRALEEEWSQIKNIDDVHEIEKKIENLISLEQNNNKIGEINNSNLNPVGSVTAYLERIIISFNQLNFQNLIVLFQKIQIYLNFNNKNNNLNENIEKNFNDSSFENFNQISFENFFSEQQKQQNFLLENNFISESQTSMVLSNKLEQFEEYIGRMNPLEIEEELKMIEKTGNNNDPLIYYLKYLNSVYQCDFFRSVELIHRYYDYKLLFIEQRNEKLRQQLEIQSLSNRTKGEKELKEGIILPYCLLDLAALHFKFSNFFESYQNIKQCIKICQENSNEICFSFALFWLAKIEFQLCIIDSHSFIDLLTSTIKKSLQLSLSHLSLMALLELQKHYLYLGYFFFSFNFFIFLFLFFYFFILFYFILFYFILFYFILFFYFHF